MIILDTSGLISALFPDQHLHESCARVLRDDPGPFILSPFVLAEVDYLICKFSGVQTELLWLEEVAREAYTLADFRSSDIRQAMRVLRLHSDLGVGLADASIVVLAERFHSVNVLTLDERHFRVLRTSDGESFRLLPADRGGRRPRRKRKSQF